MALLNYLEIVKMPRSIAFMLLSFKMSEEDHVVNGRNWQRAVVSFVNLVNLTQKPLMTLMMRLCKKKLSRVKTSFRCSS